MDSTTLSGKSSKAVALVVAVMALAGCTGASSPATPDAVAAEDGVADAHDQGYKEGFKAAEAKFNPQHRVVANRSSRATVDIEEDGNVSAWITSSKPFHLAYTVFQYAGPRFDVFLFDAREYRVYADEGAPAMEQADCSDTMTSTVHRECQVSAGRWAIVLDNSAAGYTPPKGLADPVVRVKWTYEATQEVASKE